MELSSITICHSPAIPHVYKRPERVPATLFLLFSFPKSTLGIDLQSCSLRATAYCHIIPYLMQQYVPMCQHYCILRLDGVIGSCIGLAGGGNTAPLYWNCSCLIVCVGFDPVLGNIQFPCRQKNRHFRNQSPKKMTLNCILSLVLPYLMSDGSQKAAFHCS